jgi:uncharacterized membrane protein YhaH (DUF805 family)
VTTQTSLAGLFLSARGRIPRARFWTGFGILMVLEILSIFTFTGAILGLPLIYFWACLYSKRLHDAGRSGKLAFIPLVLPFLSAILNVAGLVALLAVASSNTGNPEALAAHMGSSTGTLAAYGLMFQVVFALWCGSTSGDPRDNKYGPNPKGR